MKFSTFLSVLGVSVSIAACTPVPANRGQLLNPEQMTAIKPGMSQADVLGTLGTPTTKSSFDPHEWYYIGEFTKQNTFHAPDVKERTILVVRFDDAGTVEDVKSLSKADAQDIAMNSKKTETAGQSYNLLQQLLGNIGKFSSEQGTK